MAKEITNVRYLRDYYFDSDSSVDRTISRYSTSLRKVLFVKIETRSELNENAAAGYLRKKKS